MHCGKVLGKLVYSAKELDFLELEWHERKADHLLKKTVGGEEIELCTDSVLCERDIIYEDADRIIAVRLLPCEVTSVKVGNAEESGRLCYLLGCLGVPVQLDGQWVKFPHCEKTEELLKAEGFYGVTAEEVFGDNLLSVLKISEKTL